MTPAAFDALAHGARVAAYRIGCTTAEWLTYRANGERWCWYSKHWFRHGKPYRVSICPPCASEYRREKRREVA